MEDIIVLQRNAVNLINQGMAMSGWMATPTLQQPTTAVTMDTIYKVHTPGNVSTMALGTERPRSAAKLMEVSQIEPLSKLNTR